MVMLVKLWAALVHDDVLSSEKLPSNQHLQGSSMTEESEISIWLGINANMHPKNKS